MFIWYLKAIAHSTSRHHIYMQHKHVIYIMHIHRKFVTILYCFNIDCHRVSISCLIDRPFLIKIAVHLMTFWSLLLKRWSIQIGTSFLSDRQWNKKFLLKSANIGQWNRKCTSFSICLKLQSWHNISALSIPSNLPSSIRNLCKEHLKEANACFKG